VAASLLYLPSKQKFLAQKSNSKIEIQQQQPASKPEMVTKTAQEHTEIRGECGTGPEDSW